MDFVAVVAGEAGLVTEVEVVLREVVASILSECSGKLEQRYYGLNYTNIIASNPQSQDPKIAKIEDTLHPATKKSLDFASLKLTEDLPSRPGYGTRGSTVELTANYIELLPPSNMVLHRYDLQISPEVAGRKCFRVVQLLLQSAELASHQNNLATDFRSTLLSKVRLPHDDVIVDIVYRSEGEDEPAAKATTYSIRLLYTKTLSIGELIDYLNSTNLSQSLLDKQDLIQALNVFLNHCGKSTNNLTMIGSKKSFALDHNTTRGELGRGLETIRGFFSSVRLATCRILVNINVSHAAFFQAGPLLALMSSYGVQSTAALEKFLKLVRVQTTHLPEKRNKANEVVPRIKTIFGLARKDDGHHMDHPPRVRQHGSGAKDVEFWLDGVIKADSKEGSRGGSKKKGQAGTSTVSSSGKYISVFEFFKAGKLFSIWLPRSN